jgi:RNA polymerase sigma-70 factor (ECF subfamily)
MGGMERFTDEELIELVQAEKGSSAAEPPLNELFQRHQAKVASWCYHITGDVNSAADLAQEIFIKAFQALPSFRRGSKFTTWLYSISRNHCLDELRSRKKRHEDLSDSLPDEIEDWSMAGADSVLEQREAAQLLRQLIRESLDEMETKVMTLHYVNELPLDAVSRLLGLTNTSGAKAYVVSARRKLRRAHDLWKIRSKSTKAGKNVE